MSGFISQPVLPQYDKDKSQEENWKELTRSIEAWSTSVVRSCNDAFQRDGSRVLKSVTATLTAGTVQFQDRALSLVINATFGGGAWKSHDTARPSWALTLDSSLNQALVRRATTSTGSLAWTTFLKRPTPGCHLTKSGIQAIGTGAFEPVTWDQETQDTDGFHSLTANTSRITFPFTGWYLVSGALNWAAGTANTRRGARIRLGGATYLTPDMHTASIADGTGMGTVVPYYFTAGQYVELMAFHDGVGNLNVATLGTYFGAVML